MEDRSVSRSASPRLKSILKNKSEKNLAGKFEQVLADSSSSPIPKNKSSPCLNEQFGRYFETPVSAAVAAAPAEVPHIQVTSHREQPAPPRPAQRTARSPPPPAGRRAPHSTESSSSRSRDSPAKTPAPAEPAAAAAAGRAAERARPPDEPSVFYDAADESRTRLATSRSRSRIDADETSRNESFGTAVPSATSEAADGGDYETIGFSFATARESPRTVRRRIGVVTPPPEFQNDPHDSQSTGDGTARNDSSAATGGGRRRSGGGGGGGSDAPVTPAAPLNGSVKRHSLDNLLLDDSERKISVISVQDLGAVFRGRSPTAGRPFHSDNSLLEGRGRHRCQLSADVEAESEASEPPVITRRRHSARELHSATPTTTSTASSAAEPSARGPGAGRRGRLSSSPEPLSSRRTAGSQPQPSLYVQQVLSGYSPSRRDLHPTTTAGAASGGVTRTSYSPATSSCELKMAHHCRRRPVTATVVLCSAVAYLWITSRGESWSLLGRLPLTGVSWAALRSDVI